MCEPSLHQHVTPGLILFLFLNVITSVVPSIQLCCMNEYEACKRKTNPYVVMLNHCAALTAWIWNGIVWFKAGIMCLSNLDTQTEESSPVISEPLVMNELCVQLRQNKLIKNTDILFTLRQLMLYDQCLLINVKILTTSLPDCVSTVFQHWITSLFNIHPVDTGTMGSSRFPLWGTNKSPRHLITL